MKFYSENVKKRRPETMSFHNIYFSVRLFFGSSLDFFKVSFILTINADDVLIVLAPFVYFTGANGGIESPSQARLKRHFRG